jgi:hypothetical protein
MTILFYLLDRVPDFSSIVAYSGFQMNKLQ